MASRRAWLLIDDMNRMFAEPVVKTYPGRSRGAGGAGLMPFGERLIALQSRELDEALNPQPAVQAPHQGADAG